MRIKKIVTVRTASFILPLFLMTASVSCSLDVTTDVNRGPGIHFRAHSSPSVKATETTTNNLTDFWVTAISGTDTYFEDVQFSGSQTGTYYTSSTPYFWPSDGSTLNFLAYSPAKEDLGNPTITFNNKTKTMTGFKTEDAIADQVDFIYALASGSSANASTGVALKFGHALSQIQIKAKSENGSYTFKIKGAKIANVLPEGNLNLADGSWTGSGTKASYEVPEANSVEVTLNTNASDLMGLVGNAMLVPQQLTEWNKTSGDDGTYLAVKVNITTTSGGIQIFPSTPGEYGYACVPINTKWEPGYRYIYILDFSDGAGTDEDGNPILGNPIKFTVSVEDWKSTNPAETPVEM